MTSVYGKFPLMELIQDRTGAELLNILDYQTLSAMTEVLKGNFSYCSYTLAKKLKVLQHLAHTSFQYSSGHNPSFINTSKYS